MEQGYAVKANDIKKDVVIHKKPCGHIEKRGGAPGKYNQVHWAHFNTREEAEKYAKTWEDKGYKKKYCSFCFWMDK